MTKEQFQVKVKELLSDREDSILGSLEKECNRLFDSGGVDAEKYEDNYHLPKMILLVALENEAKQFTPFTDEEDYKNLKHF